MDTLLIYKQDQSLCGSLTDYSGEVPVRGQVRRNAYDNQSHGAAQVWTSHGWTDVQRFPISECAVSRHSYVTADGKWEESMTADLNDLVAYAHAHLAALEENN